MRVQEDQAGIKTIRWPTQLNHGTRFARAGVDYSELATGYGLLAWSYRCIRIKAYTTAGLPWGIYRGEQKLTNSVVGNIIEVVNSENNFTDLMQATVSDFLISGKSYWDLRSKNNLGFPKELFRFNPGAMRLKDNRDLSRGFFFNDEARQIPVPRPDTAFFKDFDPMDDLGAVSEMQAALSLVEMGDKANSFLDDFFENNAIPPLIMATNENIDDNVIKKMVEWWGKLFSGRGTRHKVGFVGSGLKPFKAGYSISQLGLTEMRQEIRREVCAIFGVPPGVAGDWASTAKATLKEQSLVMYRDAIIPQAEYYESVINQDFVWKFDKTIRFRFETEKLSILKPDQVAETERIVLLFKEGIINIEAAGEKLGLTPEQLGDGEPRRPSTRREKLPKKTAAMRGLNGSYASDMSKFKNKALTKIRAGKSAAVKFESLHIGDENLLDITEKLLKAKNEDDVKDIFS